MWLGKNITDKTKLSLTYINEQFLWKVKVYSWSQSGSGRGEGVSWHVTLTRHEAFNLTERCL